MIVSTVIRTILYQSNAGRQHLDDVCKDHLSLGINIALLVISLYKQFFELPSFPPFNTSV